MFHKTKPNKTSIKTNSSYTGETIEQKINRIVNNKEPISDGAPLIYTARKDGIQPAYDIRTDRFEIAVEAMDKVTKTHLAKREERAKIVPIEKNEETKKTQQNKNGEAEPLQGTDQS